MVTPEGAGSSNEPLQLDRKSITAAAIRRGDVKISEPIPWEEQNYISPPPTASQRRLQQAASDSRTQIVVAQHRSHEAVAAPEEAADEGEQRAQSFESAPRSPPLRHKRASLSMREDSEVQGHTTPVHQMMKRESGITDSPASGGSQRLGKKKRRSGGTSTIRGVFKRLFSKRDKDTPAKYAEGKSSASPGSRQHGYHRSDPLPKTAERNTKEQHADRQSNLPVERLPVPPAEEYSAGTPVPQRLPFPMNVNAPQPESPGEHYTSFNGPYVHRRRATLPSVVVPPQDASTLQKFWATPDAHLASPSDRSTNYRTPTPMIGFAVTSGANPNRRSRSAGALYDMAKKTEQAEDRRRSAEIQYWRQSYLGQEPEIVALEQHPEMKESSEHLSEQGSIISEHHSGTEISAALADAGSSIRDEPAIQSITTYDFAPSMPPSREMMDPPGPAPEPATEKEEEEEEEEEEEANLDQRLSQLEEHMRSLTSSIHDLTGRAHRQTVILESAPRGSRDRMERLSHSQSSPAMQRQPEPTAGPGLTSDPKDMWSASVPSRRFQQPSPPSSGASTASVQKTAQAPSSEASYLFSPSTAASGAGSSRPITIQQETHFISPESINFDEPPYAQYAIQRDTIIPPSLPSPSIYTHLAPLYSALRYERTQRKAMEVKITQLSEQVSQLTTIISSLRGNGGGEREGAGWKQRSRFSGYDDSDNEGAEGIAEEEEGEVEETTPMVTPLEEWTTPRQEWAPRSSTSAELGSPIEGEMF